MLLIKLQISTEAYNNKTRAQSGNFLFYCFWNCSGDKKQDQPLWRRIRGNSKCFKKLWSATTR